MDNIQTRIKSHDATFLEQAARDLKQMIIGRKPICIIIIIKIYILEVIPIVFILKWERKEVIILLNRKLSELATVSINCTILSSV